MQIHQILVRPRENTVVILYEDAVGNRSSIVVDSTGNATVNALVADCQQRLPSDTNNPMKAEIQREIAGLETRLTQLKTAIGAA
jgi:hypothetical protein